MDTASENDIPLPTISRATMQQLLTDIQLIVNQQHVANNEDQAIVHAAAQKKTNESSVQDLMNCRKSEIFTKRPFIEVVCGMEPK